MSKLTGFDKLLEAVAAGLGVSVDVIDEDTRLGELAEWDSLANLNVISRVEQSFDLSLELQEVLDLQSVADWRACLSERGVL